MRVFEAPSPEATARGAAIDSIIEGVPDAFEAKARRVLAEHGIEDLRGEEWYSMQAYLDAYETIVDTIGEATLQGIGRTTPETAEWPPGVETPFEALDSIDGAYQMNHRGEGIGYYEATGTGETAAQVECYTPYPRAYEQALIEGTAAKFASGSVSVTDVGGSSEEARRTFEVNW